MLMNHRALYPFVLASLLLVSASCALLNPREDGPDTEEDPVARIALQLRDEHQGPALSEDELDRIDHARMKGDLTTGMNQGDVLGSWGSPLEVEPVAGASPGTERWVYRGGYSRVGGVRQTRTVYFENSRVIGWETDR